MRKSQYIEIKSSKRLGRGMFAKKDIPINTNILIVQPQDFITYHKVKQSFIFARIQEDVNCKLTCFAYYLAYCENLQQAYSQRSQLMMQEYVKQLPKYYHNLICWEDSELSILSNPELILRTRQKVANLLKKFLEINTLLRNLKKTQKKINYSEQKVQLTSSRGTRIREIIPRRNVQFISKQQWEAIQKVSPEQFFKFVAAIKSRNIYFSNDADHESQVGALIPYLELFNHSQATQCRVDNFGGGKVVATIKPVRKGEEIFLKYGDNFSAEESLQNYGMIPGQELISEVEFDKQNQYSKGNDQQIKKIHFSQVKIKLERISLAYRYNQLRGGKREQKQVLSQKN